MRFDWWLAACALASLVASAGCGGDGASGESAAASGDGSGGGTVATSECLEQRADGSCLVEAPRGVDACPGASLTSPLLFGSICLPQGPRVAASCPAGRVGPTAPSDWEGPCAPVPLEAHECPPGWASADPWGLAERLEPYAISAPLGCAPEALPATCGPFERPDLPSGGACVAVGGACSGPYADEARLAAVAPDAVGARWYVSADAGAGGDGSEGAPFASVADALAAAGVGDAILLSAGAHESEGWEVDETIAIVGACAADTTLVGVGNATLIEPTGNGIVIADLTMQDATMALAVERGSTALRGVVIRDVSAPTIAVTDGARLEIEDSALRDAITRGQGSMVEVIDGGEVVVKRTSIEPADPAALLLSRGSRGTLEDVVLWNDARNVQSGYGAIAQVGSELRADRIATWNLVFADIASISNAALVDVDVAWFGDPADAGPGPLVGAMVSTAGARLIASRVTVDRANGAGAFVENASAELSAVTIVNTRRSGDGYSAGVYVGGESVVSASDVSVAWTEGAEGLSDAGAFVAPGGRVDVERTLVVDAPAYAWISADGVVELTDVRIVETGRVQHEATSFRSVEVQRSLLEAVRVRADLADGAGLVHLAAGESYLVDFDVARAEPVGQSGVAGIVLQCNEDGGRCELTSERVRLDGGALVGIRADMQLRDTEVHGSSFLRTNSDNEFAVSLMSFDPGALLDAERTRIYRSEFWGLAVLNGAVGRVVDAEVFGIDAEPPSTVREERETSAGGAFVDAGAEATFERLAVHRHRSLGLASTNSSTVRASDVYVDRVFSGAPLFDGVGISANNDATLDVERALVREAAAMGVSTSLRGQLTARDLVVVDTLGSTLSGHGGLGVAAQSGRLDAERVAVRGARVCGACSFPNAELELRHLLVERVSEDVGCEGFACIEIAYGVLGFAESDTTLRNAIVGGAGEVGVVFADDATGVLSDVLIRDVPIGVREPAGGDLMLDDTTFEGTSVDFSREEIDIPDIETFFPSN